jgi:hypothetical protein
MSRIDNVTNCRLTPTVTDPQCDFSGSPGKVTLSVVGTKGSVQFETAKLNGKDVPDPPSAQIAVTLTGGENTLDIVYAFSDPVHGRGNLREVCDGNPVLDAVRANNPAVRYVICCPEVRNDQ